MSQKVIHTHSLFKENREQLCNRKKEENKKEMEKKKITNNSSSSSSSLTSTSLPLHKYQVQTLQAILNRLHILFHLTALLFLIYYRISRILSVPTAPWILLTVSELILSFIWFCTQSFRWRPVSRTAFHERINPDQIELPGIDVFVCTADPNKEPTMEVMNTVLSALALDYPSDKISVYLSDDGGSSITLFGMKEAGVFARCWIPFCKKYDIKIRCPDAYFSGLGDDDRLLRNDEFKEEEQQIKLKYNQFKERLEKSNENASTSQDRNPLVEIILGNEESNAAAAEEEKMPRLVYVSRERRPIYPHRFKAGALNSLLRVSGIISNAPYILVLDCDMYCNDPTSAKQAMCFHLDPKLSSSLAFVQFPQIFYNVSKNDIYDGQARGAYKTKWQGMDGLRGPVLSGTGFYMKRQALYGSPKQEDAYLSEPKGCFGPSNKFIKSVCHDYKCNDNEDSLHPLTQEAGFLASCAYEKNTQWGDQIGFSYKSLLESTFTGYLLHCKGWTSVYCYPKKPCFLGCTTMNMKDAMVQAMKWCSGLFQVAISSFCPLTYGMSRMSALQSLCYAYFTFQTLFAAALLIYAIIPQLYLANGIPLYPKVSSPWFAVFSIIYVSSLCQHFIEVLSSGGTITTWWNEQRIWMIKSVTAYLFGCADVVMKWIGVAKASFTLTNKAIDQEQQKKYEKGKFDFEGATMFMIPLIILVIFNMGCFIVGVRRVIIDQSYEEMFGQVFLSFFILVLSYPILEGIITRKKRAALS